MTFNASSEMTDMEINEQNIAVAECLGWKHYPIIQDGKVWGVGWKRNGESVGTLPSFVSDANTRKEMLAGVTRDQRIKLLDFARRSYGKTLVSQIDNFHDFLLNLDQPTFTKLFLQTVGKWRE
jgi:hypothetical protein